VKKGKLKVGDLLEIVFVFAAFDLSIDAKSKENKKKDST